jgi:hypothetical protein
VNICQSHGYKWAWIHGDRQVTNCVQPRGQPPVKDSIHLNSRKFSLLSSFPSSFPLSDHLLMLPFRPPLPLLLLCLTIITLVASQSTPDPSQDSVDDYAPNTNVECPDFSTTQLIRVFTPQNQSLHPRETEYINTRTASVLPDAWKAWLGDGSAVSYNLSAFQGKFPQVGIAIPGGGLRAAQYGAGCLSGLDARNESAKAAGTGGLLQVASYISGLSGVCLFNSRIG